MQEDFDAIGRLNGGQQPPPVSAATCKNPYVDGEIPLPGEPSIVGQVGGGVTTTTALGATGTSGGGGSGGSGGGGTSGKGGHGGSGSGSSSGGNGSIHLTPAQIAAGYTVVNGHIVKKLSAGPNEFLRADDLVGASKAVGGVPTAGLLIWLALAVLLIAGIPLIAAARKRRSAAAGPPFDDGVSGGTDE